MKFRDGLWDSLECQPPSPHVWCRCDGGMCLAVKFRTNIWVELTCLWMNGSWTKPSFPWKRRDGLALCKNCDGEEGEDQVGFGTWINVWNKSKKIIIEEQNRGTENEMTRFNAWMRGRKNAFLRVWNVRNDQQRLPCIFYLHRLLKHCQYSPESRQTYSSTKTFNGIVFPKKYCLCHAVMSYG